MTPNQSQKGAEPRNNTPFEENVSMLTQQDVVDGQEQRIRTDVDAANNEAYVAENSVALGEPSFDLENKNDKNAVRDGIITSLMIAADDDEGSQAKELEGYQNNEQEGNETNRTDVVRSEKAICQINEADKNRSQTSPQDVEVAGDSPQIVNDKLVPIHKTTSTQFHKDETGLDTPKPSQKQVAEQQITKSTVSASPQTDTQIEQEEQNHRIEPEPTLNKVDKYILDIK